MKKLTTVKTFDMHEDWYSLVEYETEAFERHHAQIQRLRQDAMPISEIESDGPIIPIYAGKFENPYVIEPMRTWDLGLIEGDVVEIAETLGNWADHRIVPLQDDEVNELRDLIKRSFG